MLLWEGVPAQHPPPFQQCLPFPLDSLQGTLSLAQYILLLGNDPPWGTERTFSTTLQLTWIFLPADTCVLTHDLMPDFILWASVLTTTPWDLFSIYKTP